MRSSNSIKNSITSTVCSIILMLIGFVSQAVFIKTLGAEYLGLNGLFTNVLTVLNLFELGIGSAIVYHLYKPIADDNKEKIKSLMLFYKRAYRTIALAVFITGVLIIPFLKLIVGDITVEINIYVIYMLFLINTVSSYLLVYKRNIIYAHQKNYIINIVHIIYLLVLNISQMFFLVITKNYYLYLIIKIVCQILENIVNSFIAEKMYKYIKSKDVKTLDDGTRKDIFSKVKALMFHKMGGVIVNGTDNIIISSILGITSVGLYSNYLLIINAVKTLFGQIINSSTASVGNLLVTENSEKRFEVFGKIRFLNFILSTFSSVCIFIIINSFITIWLGEKYLLSQMLVFVLTLNYFQTMMRNSYSTFKDSAGIWLEDRYVPIIEATLNIVFSIILAKTFGLIGVFIGTLISSLALWCYSYPRFVYKKLFNRTYLEYIKESLTELILFLFITIFSYLISEYITFNNIYLEFASNIIIGATFPTVILYICFRKSEEFMYYKDLSKKILLKFKIKKH